jgi:hypothetical protein
MRAIALKAWSGLTRGELKRFASYGGDGA